MNAAAIITAAGRSTRFDSSQKKEYIFLPNNKTVLEQTLSVFLQTGLFSRIVITYPPERIEETKKAVDSAHCDLLMYIPGGSTRQESVKNGLLALETAPPDIVLIHDGARPWLTPELIKQVSATADTKGACIPVLPTTNALKQLDKDGKISAHYTRNETWAAQTPQGFHYDSVLKAHLQAEGNGRVYIDDSQLYDEFIGGVYSVEGELQNIKITYKNDTGAVNANRPGIRHS